jgi:hypothetical protein
VAQPLTTAGAVYWLDVEFAETLRRHATRPQAAEFTPEDMAGWYVQDDWLGLDGEALIPQESSLEETIQSDLPRHRIAGPRPWPDANSLTRAAALPMMRRRDRPVAAGAGIGA